MPAIAHERSECMVDSNHPSRLLDENETDFSFMFNVKHMYREGLYRGN